MVRTFCVVCREMPIRMAEGLKHIRSAGIEVEPFYGIYADTFGLVPTTPYLHADGEVKPTTVGHLGCALSHYLLMRALIYMPQEQTLVLEDDVILASDFQARLQNVLKTAPADWEFIQLGFLEGGDVVPVEGFFGKPMTRYPGGCHCYLVTKRGAERIVDLTRGMRRPWDAQLAEDCLPFMNYWCLTRSLAGQRSVSGEWFRSTIENAKPKG